MVDLAPTWAWVFLCLALYDLALRGAFRGLRGRVVPPWEVL